MPERRPRSPRQPESPRSHMAHGRRRHRGRWLPTSAILLPPHRVGRGQIDEHCRRTQARAKAGIGRFAPNDPAERRPEPRAALQQLHVRPRPLVEQRLQLPRHRQLGVDLPRHRRRVAAQVRSGAVEQLESSGRRQLARSDRVADPLAREWVDQPRRVADQRDRAHRQRLPDIAQRQMMRPQALELRRVEALRAGVIGQLAAQPARARRVAADAEIEMLALRKHPAVAAEHRAELQTHIVAPALRSRLRPLGVALERHRRAQPRQAERPPRDPVGPIRRDQHRCRERVPVSRAHGDAAVRLNRADAQPVAQICALLRRPLREKGVQTTALRHHRQRLVVAVAELAIPLVAQTEAVDLPLHHR